MNDLGVIIFGAGLQDSLNPCIFMTCAVFLAQGIYLPLGSLGLARIRSFFVLVYLLCFMFFNFGPAQIFLFNKGFILTAKILYLALGLGAFVLGVLLLKDWFFIRRGSPAATLADEKAKSFTANGVVVYLISLVLAVVLSALATLWPINNYVMLLGNEAFLHGQWLKVMLLIIGYAIISMWPFWIIWAFISIKNLRPSLSKIVCASIFFVASSCMIFIFK